MISILKKVLKIYLLNYCVLLDAWSSSQLTASEPVKSAALNVPLMNTKMRIKLLINDLTRYGILDPKEDWLSPLTSLHNGEVTGRLLIQLARSFRDLNTLNGAVTTLNIRQIIKGEEEIHYWLDNGVVGKHCNIKWIENLLKRMVAGLPIPLSSPPSFREIPLQPIQPVLVGTQYDVIIAGAGSGGCGAAIQAARMGCSVLLLEETDWVGGQMTAAGVTTMDEGCALVQERGLYRQLCGHIFSYYQSFGLNPVHPYGRYCAEPHVVRQILHKMLGDASSLLKESTQDKKSLDLLLYTTVTRILKENDCVIGVEITTRHHKVVKTQTVLSKIVVDATEWGDLLPLAGARYRVGNCTSDLLSMKPRTQGLTWTATLKHYSEGVPPDLRMEIPPPNYAKALRCFQKNLYIGGAEEFGKSPPWSWQRFIGYRAMPNSLYPKKNQTITRTQLNFNNDMHTTVEDTENLNKRQRTCRAALNKTLNLIYYIQTELEKSDWSIANDQGYDTPYQRAQIDALISHYPQFKPYYRILYHFSVMPYVRESRRMIGLHTLTAREIERCPHHPIQFPHTIALGDYFIDLHGTKQPQDLDLDLDRIEDIPQIYAEHGSGPFAIPFECFIPEQIDGFLPAEKNFSQSRLVNGATRLQPHTLLMGQAVGAIAALSIQQGVQPRMLDPLSVQRVLLDEGCTLSIKPPKSAWCTPEWKKENLQALYGPSFIPL